jgi:hypothetical protein
MNHILICHFESLQTLTAEISASFLSEFAVVVSEAELKRFDTENIIIELMINQKMMH